MRNAHSSLLVATIVGTSLGLATHTLGQCTYALAPTVPTSTALGPVNCLLVDYSGDGLLDLAVSCQTAGAVLFYPGNGTGSFNNGSGFGAGANPDGLCSGDFNQDGRPDFAAAGSTGLGNPGFICLYLNVNGLPGNTSLIPSGGNTSVGIATADFNGDGHLDLAVTNSYSNNVAVLFGTGTGTFGAAVTYPVGGGPDGVAAADLNADGRPDLVVANSGTNSVTVLYCSPTGTFPTWQTINVGIGQPRSVGIGDFNGDGRKDLAIAGTFNGANLSLIFATGPVTYGPPTTSTLGSGAARSLVVADMNRDGKPDILMSAGTTVVSLLGNGQGGFATVTTPANGQDRGVAVGDLTGDGVPDAVAALMSTNQYQVIRNTTTSAPFFTQQPTHLTTHPGVQASLSITAIWNPTSYVWSKDGVPLVPSNPAFTGEDTPILTILNPTLADNLSVYQCTASNACGSTTSRPAAFGVVERCGHADFNGDGDVGTDADIEAFFRVLAGGPC